MVAGTVPGPPFDSAFDNVTTAPHDGAAAISVTVPVDDAPPTRSTGLMFNPLTPVGPPGVISSSVWTPGLPASPAKMFMLNCEVTANVVIVKVALVAPAGTVTLLGIVATFAGAGVESATTVAPLSGPLNVTVPTEELPPTTLQWLTDTPWSTGGGVARP